MPGGGEAAAGDDVVVEGVIRAAMAIGSLTGLAISQEQEQLKALDKQLQQLHAKLAAYPNPRTYTVDCLALKTELEHGGVEVYDHGAIAR